MGGAVRGGPGPQIVVEDAEGRARAYDPVQFWVTGKLMPVLQACLLCFVHARGRVTKVDLQGAFNLQYASATERVQKLERAGYLTTVRPGRRGCPSLYAITPKGKKAIGVTGEQ